MSRFTAIATVLIALCAYSVGAAAQPAGQGQRDQKAADAMEKERLKAEAKPAQVYIPPPKPEAAAADGKPVMSKAEKPKVFTATVPAKPGDKAAKKTKKKSAKAKAAPKKAA